MTMMSMMKQKDEVEDDVDDVDDKSMMLLISISKSNTKLKQKQTLTGKQSGKPSQTLLINNLTINKIINS